MALLQKYDHVIGLMKDVGNAVVTLVSQMANVILRVTNLEDGIDDDFLGGWNAATNTPALAAGVGVQNKWYQVTIAGTQSITGVSQSRMARTGASLMARSSLNHYPEENPYGYH